ncbi:MAG TPA: flagellar hook-associated protein FlgL [Gemmatimonadales bacterium]|nr:flagellar hook-associated protein FlgL [Gemmatimonadales bacterium]
MRITNSLLQQRVLRDLQSGLSQFADAQRQVSTGKRFERISEAPLAGSQVMDAQRALRGIEQYRRNSAAAQSRTSAEESVLDQLGDLLSRAKELALQEGSATSTTQTRTAAKQEVDRIIEQVVQLGNTQVNNEYIFGGHMTTTSPFNTLGVYQGDDGQRLTEIGQGYTVATNHTGRELLVDSGVLSSLQALSTELGSGTPGTIGLTATGLDGAFNNTQALLATNGARVRQIDSALSNADALQTNFELRINDLQGIDIEEATTRFVGIQTTLQAAMLSSSRILNTTLTDYLR